MSFLVKNYRVENMRRFTYKDIESWKPCYSPDRHLPTNWEGTAIDILKHDKIPFPDKLWVICRTEILSDKIMRLFAVWCARQVQHLMKDPRSLNALDVAEKFANGNATKDELAAAWDAAWGAAWDAARDAAWGAAWDAARDAARDAAWAAAWAAARGAAGDAAWAAAWAAARGAQRDKLIEMIEADDKPPFVSHERVKYD